MRIKISGLIGYRILLAERSFDDESARSSKTTREDADGG